MTLANSIERYYFEKLSALPPDKQFHFASRVASWEGHPEALAAIERLREYIIPDDSSRGLIKLFKELSGHKQNSRINSFELRAPFFKKYPNLWGINLALFRARHLKYFYDIDAKEQLLQSLNEVELDKLSKSLLNNPPALRILSTFAVNFLYLYEDVLLSNRSNLDPEYLIEIAKEYDLSNVNQVQLMIYLFTHSIIGESNFYIRSVRGKSKQAFLLMLESLERIIQTNFSRVNLDNKLEFLVCCRICNYDSSLFDSIWKECENSISGYGLFIIDKLNTSLRSDRNTLDRSEHRNVLYIMSCSKYEPREANLNLIAAL